MMRPTASAAATLAMVVVAAPGMQVSPTLKVVDREPLVVRGSGFGVSERVTVTALTGLGPRVAHATARSGAFRVTFRLPAIPCAAAFAVRAKGSQGSSAVLHLTRSAPCVPPPRD